MGSRLSLPLLLLAAGAAERSGGQLQPAGRQHAQPRHAHARGGDYAEIKYGAALYNDTLRAPPISSQIPVACNLTGPVHPQFERLGLR